MEKMDESIILDFDETLGSDHSVPDKWSALIFGFVLVLGLPVLVPVAFISWSILGIKTLFGVNWLVSRA